MHEHQKPDFSTKASHAPHARGPGRLLVSVPVVGELAQGPAHAVAHCEHSQRAQLLHRLWKPVSGSAMRQKRRS